MSLSPNTQWRRLPPVAVLASALLVSLFGLPLPGNLVPAHAATLTVTSTNDSGAGSLRAALTAAQPGDTITFNLPSGPQTITLTSGTLTIPVALTLRGPGTGQLAIDGGGSYTVFDVEGGPTTISGLTIQNGYYNSSSSFYGGGNIYVAPTAALTLAGDVVTGGQATDCYYGGNIYNDGTLTLDSSTVSNGYADCEGGGLYSDGTVAVSGSTFLANYVDPSADGFGALYGAAAGGAIYNDDGGTLAITSTTFQNNYVNDPYFPDYAEGGAIWTDGLASLDATTVLTGNSVTGGNGSSDYGGGIYNDDSDSTLYLNGTTLTGNYSDYVGGGLYNDGTANLGTGTTLDGNYVDAALYQNGPSGGGGGGGIWNDATLALTGTTLYSNTVTDPYFADMALGGGLVNTSALTVVQSQILSNTVSGGNAPYGGGLASGYYVPGVSVAITGSTILSNTVLGSGAFGGGVSLINTQGSFSNDTLQNNAAIYQTPGFINGCGVVGASLPYRLSCVAPGHQIHPAHSPGTVHLRTEIVHHARAAHTGEGTHPTIFHAFAHAVHAAFTGTDTAGGGLYLDPGSVAAITGTTIYSNSATYGGGINNDGAAMLADSTVYSNTAVGPAGLPGQGGGIFNGSSAVDLVSAQSLVLTNTTLAANAAPGGLGDSLAGTAAYTLANTIVAGAGDSACASASGITSNGGNIFNDATCFTGSPAPGDQQSANLLLGPLGNYGGPTQTVDLLPGSPAIGFGTAAGCAQVGNVDQRGDPRPGAHAPAGTTCDSGAFEVQYFGLVPPLLPTGVLSSPYQTTIISPTGGTGPYLFTTTGTLPPGLTLNPTTGALSGIPTLAGTFAFTVTATDSLQQEGIQPYVVTIYAACGLVGALVEPNVGSVSFFHVLSPPVAGQPDQLVVTYNQVAAGLLRRGVLTVNHPVVVGCTAQSAVLTGTVGGANLPAQGPTSFWAGDGVQVSVQVSGTLPVSATVVVSDTTRQLPVLVLTTAVPGGRATLQVQPQP